MRHYAADIVVFDLLPPLQYRGIGAVEQRLSEWFAAFAGPIGFEMRDLGVVAGHHVAYCFSINGVKGTTRSGADIEMWWRATCCFRKEATCCFRKEEGGWLITHAHSSEPFDIEAGKALIKLQP